MNKKKIICTIASIVLIIVVGVVGYLVGSQQTGFQPSFRVIGDIDEEIIIESLKDYELTSFSYSDETIKGVSIHTLIDSSTLLDANSNILIVGADGFASEISYQSAAESYIVFSKENGWEIMNVNHPPSCDIKNIKEIVVVSAEETSNYVFSVFTENENLYGKTIGQMYLDITTSYYSFEGTSKINDNFVTVYMPHTIFDMQDMMQKYEVDEAYTSTGMLFLDDGSIVQVPLDGYIELDGCDINYVSYDTEYEYLDVGGMYLGDPVGYLGDVYYDMEHYLTSGKNVMLLYVDGFSYEMYEKSLEMDIIPNLATGDVRKVVTVYKSVTNAGFATMITGQTPNINGVHSRDERALLVDSIFQIALDEDIPTAFLEASTQILDTEIKPSLNVNGDESILQETIEAVYAGNEFIFTHTHQLDEMGHSYGPYDDRLYDYLEMFDEYLGEIMECFEGEIYITSDHGMHKTAEGGDHGSLRYEDMIIPIIHINTEK
ncbi:MAG: alkaline phosphatase family protein [Lachnospiraceae bacterium]